MSCDLCGAKVLVLGAELPIHVLVSASVGPATTATGTVWNASPQHGHRKRRRGCSEGIIRGRMLRHVHGQRTV